MARIEDSPFGKISGTLGDMVFRRLKNGKQIAQKRPDFSQVKPSGFQQVQRNKLKTAMALLSPLKGLIRDAYQPFQKNSSGFDAAKSYIMKEAIVVKEGGYVLDYRKVMVTFGDLRIPEGVVIAVNENDEELKIDLHWEDNSHQALAYSDDELILVVYVADEGRFIYFKGLAERQALQATATFNISYASKELHLWMSFLRPHERRASPSVYLGKIV